MPDEYNDPTENEINDWNIHNDHQDGNDEPEDIEDETPEPETFRIADGRLEYLKERFERIAKRARRIKCAAPTFEILSTEDVPEQKWSEVFQGMELTGRVLRFHTVRLIGERPIIAGYKFLGTLEHNSEVGLILRAVPGEAIPPEYREADPTNCDHCRKRIKTRTETFIVEHVETQTRKQVGRRCVADFLGGVDPKAVLALVEMLSEAHDVLMAGGDDDDERSFGGRVHELYDMIHVLALTSALCRNYGWTSRGQAKLDETGRKTATANRADSWLTERGDRSKLFMDRYGNVDRAEMAKYETTDADYAIAELALDWARGLSERSDLNDYLYNLTTIAKAGAVHAKHFGLACSIVSSYNREQEKLLGIEREAKQGTTSEHFGEIKKRAEYVLTVTRYSTSENDFGVTHIFGFDDADGNKAVWFGSNDPGMELGHTYKVKATVKNHGDYRGVKQTILTRVALIEEIPAQAESFQIAA